MVDNTINNQNENNENENNQNETKETSYMDLTFFNNTLQEFLKLDQEIKKLSKAVKIRRDKKNQLSEMILLFLIPWQKHVLPQPCNLEKQNE